MRHPGFLITTTVAAALLLIPARAEASFHLWRIAEVFSNADGTVQYIELVSASNGQEFVGTRTITTNSNGTIRTFTFPSNSPTGTANKRLLLATPGLSAVPCAVTPDFVLPSGFFTPGPAGTITIDFAGADALTFPANMVPTNGINALHDTTPGGTATLVVAVNSPTNFAGAASVLDASSCVNEVCAPCNDGLFCNGAEACSGGACVAAGACNDICDEGNNTCVECNSPTDCDDSNPCTTDACTANECVITNNTLTCDDTFFCTTTDVCGGGTCNGSGDACPGQSCLEGSNSCGVCTVAADCDDGVFCNGVETCLDTTSCLPAAAGPCNADLERCDEVDDQCDPLCGNGALDGAEVCDDSNAVAGDGCGTDCLVEDGWSCDGVAPSTCTQEPAPPDAGVPDPDAAITEPPTEPEDGGCCSTGAPRTGSALLSLLVLGLALRRRRRSGRRAGA